MNEKDKQRFWSKVAKAGPDDCWEWIASRHRNGYGSFWLHDRDNRAHRVSWTLANNRPIPDGLCVLHRCDNPSCVNPAHLFLGTQADNNADKVQKGRQVNGEDHGQSQLTTSDVVAIRKAYAAGSRTYRDLAEEFNCAPTSIGFVVRGEYWKHADGPLLTRSTQRAKRNTSKRRVADVVAIREAYALDGKTYQELASEYGCDRATISRIVRGETWKHVGGPVTRRRGEWAYFVPRT